MNKKDNVENSCGLTNDEVMSLKDQALNIAMISTCAQAGMGLMICAIYMMRAKGKEPEVDDEDEHQALNPSLNDNVK